RFLLRLPVHRDPRALAAPREEDLHPEIREHRITGGALDRVLRLGLRLVEALERVLHHVADVLALLVFRRGDRERGSREGRGQREYGDSSIHGVLLGKSWHVTHSIASMRARPSTGLRKKRLAPASNASRATCSRSSPVRAITGMSSPRTRRRSASPCCPLRWT